MADITCLNGCLPREGQGGGEGRASEITQGKFGSDGYNPCLACGEVFTGIYICQNLSSCTL